ncbi:MAG: DUF4180 domain-containing protein [Lacrimispora sp.]|uniref:DUF4180 domain-containing protein n=1 Tax=Lacrimispora sp. TaxID=2719234 RepID=UPI0039E32EE9
MNIVIMGDEQNIAVIRSEDILITDVQSALDLAMTVSYETGIHSLVLPKTCLTNDFFVLSTRLAGEVLQKYINYKFKLAVWGDYSVYNSKPLHDFIYESNHGKDFFFVGTEAEAIEKLKQFPV